MTNGQARGLVVTGILIAAEPKAASGDAYEWRGNQQVPKGNKLKLVIEVPIPRPTPPVDFERWEGTLDHNQYTRHNKVDSLKRQLEKELAEEPKAAKPPKGAHFFQIDPEAVPPWPGAPCIGHKKCGRTQPDSVKCFPIPEVLSIEERKAEAQARLDAAIADRQQQQLADYNAYVAKATNDTRAALAASLGSGMFFALLNQEVQVTFEPSSRVFQPFLDMARLLPEQLSIETPVLAQLPARTGDVSDDDAINAIVGMNAEDED